MVYLCSKQLHRFTDSSSRYWCVLIMTSEESKLLGQGSEVGDQTHRWHPCILYDTPQSSTTTVETKACTTLHNMPISTVLAPAFGLGRSLEG